ncbi:8-oxo-dGTP diphosphatase MutT, partial [Klebsiella pneumoniae]|nr:8-oxo-dGTP diphosphatase MutT [Klebsiella pneumoniae]
MCIRDSFITRRAADAHMANKLEFPGGKIEMGETPEQAVVRELQEEVGITPQHFSLFEKLEYEFPDRHITPVSYTHLTLPTKLEV